MSWLDGCTQARDGRIPGGLITQVSVRGHAPREAGAKMFVTADQVYGTIGGGNLEQTSLHRARELILTGATEPELSTVRLNDRVRTEHGRQCCGGEVTVLLEPQPVPPAIAIFGVGHVGLELARILARRDLDLYLTDSRPEQLDRRDLLEPSEARIDTAFSMMPEQRLAALPTGCQVVIMTHDHAEDYALCDAALRTDGLGPIGLIGSATKWRRFRHRLIEAGHEPAVVDRIACPIGLVDLPAKDPLTIAVSIAALLLGGRAPNPTFQPS